MNEISRAGLHSPLLVGTETNPTLENSNKDQRGYVPPGGESPRTVVEVPSPSQQSRKSSSFTSVASSAQKPLSSLPSGRIQQTSSPPHREISAGGPQTPLLKGQKKEYPTLSLHDKNQLHTIEARRSRNEQQQSEGRPPTYSSEDVDYIPPIYDEATGRVFPGNQKKNRLQ